VSEDNLYEEPKEVLFRPSYSATWLNCEAALLDGRFYPDSAGIDAARGTVFHDVMHEWLRTGVRPYYRLGDIAEVWPQEVDDKTAPFLIEIDEEMFYNGRKIRRFLRRFVGAVETHYERRVDISHITPIPNQTGTADFIYLNWKRLDIVDHKYGMLRVMAEGNTQELLYADAAFEELDYIYGFETIGLHIAQPRLNHFDSWEISRKDLLKWREGAKVRARNAWKRKGRIYTVGVKQCTWCKRRDDCRAKLAALEQVADEIADQSFTVTPKEAKAVTVFTPPRSMETTILRLSLAEMIELYKWRNMFETWFRRLGERILERGLEGEDLGDFYVTEGRKFKHWINPKQLAQKLSLIGVSDEDMYIERKLKSPNQMMKVLREHGFRGKVLDKYIDLHTDRLPGKPTLAKRGNDERPELPDYTEGFDAEDV
jgi:Casjensviridae exonuclease